jgi:chemotaxis protein methyltransferase CheR
LRRFDLRDLPRNVPHRVKDLVERRLGLAVPPERLPELARAIEEVAHQLKSCSVEAIQSLLNASPDSAEAWVELTSRLTVKETYFFRDEACFRAIENTILPSLVAARRESGARRLRLWSAACATGEEAYSLAILVDRLLPDRLDWDVTILATDVDAKAIAHARRGRYRAWSLRQTPPELQELCFARRSGQLELHSRLRGMVSFEAENLAAGGARGPIDLILCRNALMYLTPDASQAAIERLCSSLAEDGWLAVSPAEASAERFRPLVPVSLPGAIFFRGARHGTGLSAGGVGSRRAEAPARRDGWSAPSRKRRSAPASEGRFKESLSVADWLARARASADRGALEEALASCREALTQDPLSAGAHLLLGVVHQERGDLDAAGAALRRAVFLAPASAEAHAAIGQLLLKRGDRRRGLKHLAAAAALAGGPG